MCLYTEWLAAFILLLENLLWRYLFSSIEQYVYVEAVVFNGASVILVIIVLYKVKPSIIWTKNHWNVTRFCPSNANGEMKRALCTYVQWLGIFKCNFAAFNANTRVPSADCIYIDIYMCMRQSKWTEEYKKTANMEEMLTNAISTSINCIDIHVEQ